MLQIGLVTVIASSEAVTTQVYCVWVPSRSAMIVGSAVETMVALTIATNSADIRPTRTSRISWWLISPGVGSGMARLGAGPSSAHGQWWSTGMQVLGARWQDFMGHLGS